MSDQMNRAHATSAVVVGYDGTPAGDAALDWAAREAKGRGVGLRVVTASNFVGLTYTAGLGGALPPFDSTVSAQAIAADGRLRAQKIMDGEDVTSLGEAGVASQVLIRESRTAGLLVVGHTARSRVREFFTGATSFPVTAHAPCDVAIIPEGWEVPPSAGRPVVVGVDGSASADRAVTVAAEAAERWSAPLEIVQAWRMSIPLGWPNPMLEESPIGEDVLQKQALDSTERIADSVRHHHPTVPLRTLVIEEQPVPALLAASDRAGLLVVGTRGLGGFERLMLGSVSRTLLHHLRVPLLVARSPREG